MFVIPALEGGGRRARSFKVLLSYMVNLKLAWEMKGGKETETENSLILKSSTF